MLYFLCFSFTVELFHWVASRSGIMGEVENVFSLPFCFSVPTIPSGSKTSYHWVCGGFVVIYFIFVYVMCANNKFSLW